MTTQYQRQFHPSNDDSIPSTTIMKASYSLHAYSDSIVTASTFPAYIPHTQKHRVVFRKMRRSHYLPRHRELHIILQVQVFNVSSEMAIPSDYFSRERKRRTHHRIKPSSNAMGRIYSANARNPHAISTQLSRLLTSVFPIKY